MSIPKLFIGMSYRRLNDQTNKWETSKSFAVEAIAWEDRAEFLAAVREDNQPEGNDNGESVG